MMSSAESYTEEVPVNPILNFLGLLRFDKNYEKLKGTHRVEFDSPEAEVCYNRIIK